jgi:polysaccharide biosynthesis protein PslH
MTSSPLNILLLSPYLPAVDTGATARKIYEHICLLNQNGHQVYLLSFCSRDDKKMINSISSLCKGLYLEYLQDYSRYSSHSVKIKELIKSVCREKAINILQCENSFLSRFIPTEINVPLVLMEHSILSKSFYERVKFQSSPINKLILLARSTKKFFEEKRWYRRFNKIIVFSQEDKDYIHKLYNVKNIEIIPLGINLEERSLFPPDEKIYDLIFVGNFSYIANADAVLYFYKNIFPLVINRIPNISLIITGANPNPEIRKLAKLDRNITVTGYAPDVKQFYHKSKIFIAPIRYGTGMRLKILDALASRIPVVTTSVGARGLISKENVKVADTESDFANSVIDLLNNKDEYRNLAEKGRTEAERYYNNAALFGSYEKIYYGLVN